MAEFDELRAAMARNRDAIASAKLLINDLVEKVRACASEPDSNERLKALAAELEADAGALASAVVAGTPHQPSNQ